MALFLVAVFLVVHRVAGVTPTRGSVPRRAPRGGGYADSRRLARTPAGVTTPSTRAYPLRDVPEPVFPLAKFPAAVFLAAVFPAAVFPAAVFPAAVFPAAVFPAAVFPAAVFPAAILPVAGVTPTRGGPRAPRRGLRLPPRGRIPAAMFPNQCSVSPSSPRQCSSPQFSRPQCTPWRGLRRLAAACTHPGGGYDSLREGVSPPQRPQRPQHLQPPQRPQPPQPPRHPRHPGSSSSRR